MNGAYKRHVSSFSVWMRALLVFVYAFVASSRACLSDQYPADPWPHACHACPPHTTTSAARSIHDCRCNPGFICTYYRQVRATVTVQSTLSAFEHDEGGVRTGFLAGVAAAAGVELQQVRVHYVEIRLSHRRRTLADTIQVTFVLSASSGVDKLRAHLQSAHVSTDAWQEQRRVLVHRVSTEGI